MTQKPEEWVAREEALKWFLKMIVSAEGFVSSYDGGGDATNVFCGDFEPTDTWNWAEERGLTTTSFDSMSETSTARITDAGRAYLAASPSPEGTRERGELVTRGDIMWLERAKDVGHCGEGSMERRGRDEHNARIDRILAALTLPPVPGVDRGGSSCTETAARGTTASRPDSSCKSEGGR
jgi:hypothetical protein